MGDECAEAARREFLEGLARGFRGLQAQVPLLLSPSVNDGEGLRLRYDQGRMRTHRKAEMPSPAEPADDVTVAALRAWRDALITLSSSNRLLNLDVRRKTNLLVLVDPVDPARMVSRLVAEKDLTANRFTFLASLSEEEEGEVGGSLTLFGADTGNGQKPRSETPKEPTEKDLPTRLPEASLAAALRTLQQKTNTDFLDSGVWVLYLAVGMLRWTDNEKELNSPLLTIPVVLEGGRRGTAPTLRRAEYDVEINPALSLKLAEYGIRLPEWDSWFAAAQASGKSPDAIWPSLVEEIRAALASGFTEDWELDSSAAALTYFNFSKVAMYRDLLANEETVLQSEHVRALARTGRADQNFRMLFDPVEPRELEAVAPLEYQRFILDADSSQRICIQAALDGKSFTIQGPPGTGKSQTIANMIAALIAEGKSVLFVSEKAAALEVVRDRLAAAGLLPYLFELHSAKTKRREVAAALGQALASHTQPLGAIASEDIAELGRLRKRLDTYASAVNEVPSRRNFSTGEDEPYPLNQNVINAIGRLEGLVHLPRVPGPEDIETLTLDDILDVRTAAQTLSRAWGPIAQQETHLWFGLKETVRLDAALTEALSALRRLETAHSVYQEIAAQGGINELSDIPRLLTLLDYLATRPHAISRDWYVVPTRPASEMVQRLLELLRSAARAEAELASQGVTEWSLLRRTAAPKIQPFGAPAEQLDCRALSGAELRALADSLKEHSAALARTSQYASAAAAQLDLPDPATLSEHVQLANLLLLTAAVNKPASHWLTRQGLEEARTAAQELQAAYKAEAEAAHAASPYFTRDCLQVDLGRIRAVVGSNPGILERRKKEYKEACQRLAAVSTGSRTGAEQAQRIHLALSWQEAHSALWRKHQEYETVLGTYYQGYGTDWEAVHSALDVATQVVEVTNNMMSGAFKGVVTGETPRPDLAEVSPRIREAVTAWQARLTSLAETPLPQALHDKSLAQTVKWLDHYANELPPAANNVTGLEREIGRSLTYANAESITQAVAVRCEADEELAIARTAAASLLCNVPHETEEDLRRALENLAWISGLRDLLRADDQETLPGGLVAALDMPIETPSYLTEQWEQWTLARDRIKQAFSPVRQHSLETEFDLWETARSLLTDLKENPEGQEEWLLYQDAKRKIASKGLSAALVDITDIYLHGETGLDPSDVPDILEKAMRTTWVEHVLTANPALMVNSDDHSSDVQRFQELDRRLISKSNLETMEKINRHRPKTLAGKGQQAILAESKKKSGHKSVRTVIQDARDIITRIKPVMMMSPLSVSQYIPPDMTFDVVIFDEASQVLPGDAINAIYRAKQLIIAGDDKQLPPWAGFTSTASDDDQQHPDYESILTIALACGAYRDLPLTWHYRSRHEDLITFSKRSFYSTLERPLVTFPSATETSPDLGVEFYFVDNGIYERGGAAHNMPEAFAVAERVLHHIRTRPDMTLGVVTFSRNQADAVLEALDQLRAKHRDLDQYLATATERLSGFFVKNLETVQGDERDVMIFSVGYGPDANGHFTNNFGPLSKEGGWRRLNVAVTRAKYRNEVVASITAKDITPSSESVRHFQRFLDYAERGPAALDYADPESLGAPDSPFEEAVIAQIEDWGYTCVPQVGSAGFRVDIGVRHPKHPEVFMAGIECDGATYHSSPSARDRDRLRQDVLEGLGWNIHRVWSTNWFRHRAREAQKLHDFLQKQERSQVVGLTVEPPPPVDPAPSLVVAVDFEEPPTWVYDYEMTPVLTRMPVVTLSSNAAIPVFETTINDIATTEGPIHIETLLRRLRNVMHIGRISPSARQNIDKAISNLKRDGRIEQDGNHYRSPSPDPVRVRKLGPRKHDEVSPDEIDIAVLNLVEDAISISPEDLAIAVRGIYETPRSADLDQQVASSIARLTASGRITGEDALRLN